MKYKFYNKEITINKKIIGISYKNIYYFKKNKKKNPLLFNLSFKIFFFYNLNKFIKKNNLKKKNFYNIIFSHYNFLWYFFLNSKNLAYYHYLLKMSLVKYKNLFFFKNDEIFMQNYNIMPNSFLNLNSLSISNNFNLNEFYIKNLVNYFHNSFNKNKKKINNLNFINILKFKKKNYNFSKININFLRIQRRYNKRRYSKVRVNSRPSFFSGISLSSIFLGLLYGGTIKGVDWLTSWIIKIDINLIIFSLIFYFIFRVWKLKFFNTIIKKKNKIRIINSLQNMFIFNFWLKNKF